MTIVNDADPSVMCGFSFGPIKQPAKPYRSMAAVIRQFEKEETLLIEKYFAK